VLVLLLRAQIRYAGLLSDELLTPEAARPSSPRRRQLLASHDGRNFGLLEILQRASTWQSLTGAFDFGLGIRCLDALNSLIVELFDELALMRSGREIGIRILHILPTPEMPWQAIAARGRWRKLRMRIGVR